MQAGRTSEENKKAKEELELRLKLLTEMEEKLKDDGEHALYTAYISLLHAVPCNSSHARCSVYSHC